MNQKNNAAKKNRATPQQIAQELAPGQSIPLLQALHILTRDGQLNADSRRKLKQVQHLFNLLKPILDELAAGREQLTLIDVGAGKSYLGFILYDLFFKHREHDEVIAVEKRPELVHTAKDIAREAGFTRMRFIEEDIQDARLNFKPTMAVNMLTALHACDTATDLAIDCALHWQAEALALVPCCQAEIARYLQEAKPELLSAELQPLHELWAHPHHRREFASHLTNVLRCLRLEAHGYSVRVTELIGWEHSLKNELIMAKRSPQVQRQKARAKLDYLVRVLGLPPQRFA